MEKRASPGSARWRWCCIFATWLLFFATGFSDARARSVSSGETDQAHSCMVSYFRRSGFNPTVIEKFHLERSLALAGLDIPRIRLGNYTQKLRETLKVEDLVTALESCATGENFFCRGFPPCLHGGLCRLNASSMSYFCDCPEGYGGFSCADFLLPTTTLPVTTQDPDEDRSCMMSYFHMSGYNSTIVKQYKLEQRVADAGLDMPLIRSGLRHDDLTRALQVEDVITALEECASGKNFYCLSLPPCLHGSECVLDRTLHKFVCNCSQGFTGFSCADDIDECSARNHSLCTAKQSCVNTLGSYNCSDVDVDECVKGQHNCTPLQVCHNTHGSYTCDDGDAERLSDLLDKIERKMERRKSRPRTHNRERYMKMLKKLNTIATAMKTLATVENGNEPREVDQRPTIAPSGTLMSSG